MKLKKYLFHTFGGGGVPPDSVENSILFFFIFIEPFPNINSFSVCLDSLPKMSTHLDLLSGPITADFSGTDIVVQGEEPIEEHSKTNQCSWQQPSCVET